MKAHDVFMSTIGIMIFAGPILFFFLYVYPLGH